jgi:hypothetical protein
MIVNRAKTTVDNSYRILGPRYCFRRPIPSRLTGKIAYQNAFLSVPAFTLVGGEAKYQRLERYSLKRGRHKDKGKCPCIKTQETAAICTFLCSLPSNFAKKETVDSSKVVAGPLSHLCFILYNKESTVAVP